MTSISSAPLTSSWSMRRFSADDAARRFCPAGRGADGARRLCTVARTRA